MIVGVILAAVLATGFLALTVPRHVQNTFGLSLIGKFSHIRPRSSASNGTTQAQRDGIQGV
jgi:hypothetical protein